MKKVAIIIASHGYQPVEYGAPKHILEAAGLTVVTISDEPGEAEAAYDGSRTKVDVVLTQVQVGDYDGVFLVGGPGAPRHLENENVYKIMREVATSGKPWGAICYSTRVLAHAGILKDRKVTGWDGDGELEGILIRAGAEYVREPVWVDRDLITAVGPKFAEAWGKEILKKL